MASLTRLCSEPEDFAGASTTGAALPFLPTLAIAAVLALGAICWESATPVPGMSGDTLADAALPRIAQAEAAEAGRVDPPLAQAEATPRSPAAIVFAAQFPLSGEVALLAQAPVPRSLPRIARSGPAQPACAGSRCAEPGQTASATLRRPQVASPSAGTPPAPAEPFASMGGETPGSERLLPERALPFAPAIRAVRQTVGRTVDVLGAQVAILRGEAVAFGGAVTDLVDGLH